MDTRREQIIEIVKREFFGPDPINLPGLIQENGEEILSSDPPRIRYAAGILFPQNVKSEHIIEEYEPERVEQESSEEDAAHDEHFGGVGEYLQDAEELMNLSNAYQQSAISLTVAVRNDDAVSVSVSAGAYITVKERNEETGVERVIYPRKKINWNNGDDSLPLPDINHSVPVLKVTNDEHETNLRFHVTYRYERDNYTVYTFTLENSIVNNSGHLRDEDCYFQVEFTLKSNAGFAPMPDNEKLNINDNDYLSNQMLYRDVKTYAIGHGCAAAWDEMQHPVTQISTSIFPVYEIKPIVPNSIDGVVLEMYRMSDYGKKEDIISELTLLCDNYDAWVNKLSQMAVTVSDHGTAARHIANCQECLKRMRDGVELLNSNEKVLQAFQMMNRAMLLQQLHYNLPLQSWTVAENDQLVLQNAVEVLPDIKNKDTWFGNKDRYGKWRPFQLAFVLINLRSMLQNTCSERSIVDLIWFPTGGGKTEAYLGLSAYTIFIRRLINKDNSGTTILMRYTLRLLTSQQYERASSMICACETIRKENETVFGTERISIGLWVGGETSPNSMHDALKDYKKLYNGTSDVNPFVVLKCPWCGAQMGVVNKGRTRETPGYRCVKRGRKEYLIFQCRNNAHNCTFSRDGFELPLYVVDDDIYSKTPTLLLGTVDKFAMLPYRPEAQTIFGIHDGQRVTAPDLIIQDELHLISGPLGSMVGHYETMIHELCSYNDGANRIQPKVIASTATISRAAEQCHALYGCGKDKVRQFPPSGLDAGDSFFAVENKASNGRKYVGILASGSSSIATTTIRLYAALLYAGKAITVDNEFERDAYWTNVGYFNSIRELGQTETWIRADIDEYLHVIYKRRYEDRVEGYKEKRRYIWRDEELTSRIRSDKIPVSLQNLNIKYPTADNEKRPVDICLATNMISVGVDVPRLGLMTVSGQPKTTSEYIQATSRVGRSSDAPGLVFTIYNPGKPRDKSYYEHFIPYHSRVYCNVEPTSVTPFSAPLRERALHALIIGIMRLEGDKALNNNPPSVPDAATLRKIKKVISERISDIDPEELDKTMAHIDAILEKWKLEEPQKYQDFTSGEELPLMFPAGTMRNEAWGQERGFPTLTSMRSVDASCEARVIESGYHEEDE